MAVIAVVSHPPLPLPISLFYLTAVFTPALELRIVQKDVRAEALYD